MHVNIIFRVAMVLLHDVTWHFQYSFSLHFNLQAWGVLSLTGCSDLLLKVNNANVLPKDSSVSLKVDALQCEHFFSSLNGLGAKQKKKARERENKTKSLVWLRFTQSQPDINSILKWSFAWVCLNGKNLLFPLIHPLLPELLIKLTLKCENCVGRTRTMSNRPCGGVEWI